MLSQRGVVRAMVVNGKRLMARTVMVHWNRVVVEG